MAKKKAATASSDFDGLAAPARRALANAGIKNLAALAEWKKADVAELHGMGPNALSVLVSSLKAKRLSFAKPK